MVKARENPFQVERLHHIPLRLPDGGLREISRKLDEFNWRGAIVGTHGAGKTRLLDEIQKELHREGVPTLKIFLNDRNKKIPWLQILFSPMSVVFVDGAEQLKNHWWRILEHVTQRNQGLIITSHKEGLLPTIVKMETSPELLGDIMGELGADQDLLKEVDYLFEKHRGNIREALRECYNMISDNSVVHVR